MDPQEMFKRLMMGQQGAPTQPAAAQPAANEDILKSLLLSPSGAGSVPGRPDPIGGVNHQGRALETMKQMMSNGQGGK